MVCWKVAECAAAHGASSTELRHKAAVHDAGIVLKKVQVVVQHSRLGAPPRLPCQRCGSVSRWQTAVLVLF